MAYTAANYSARDAEKMGLVSHVCADQAGLRMPRRNWPQIAANAPGHQKHEGSLNFSRYVNVYDMSMAVQKNACYLTDDMKEAIAFLERRRRISKANKKFFCRNGPSCALDRSRVLRAGFNFLAQFQAILVQYFGRGNRIVAGVAGQAKLAVRQAGGADHAFNRQVMQRIRP